jgi:hypothetical protein
MINQSPYRRPTCLEEIFKCMAKFNTQEGRRRGLSFKPLATDVIISPYSKCGTTWLQQIVHCLRTSGSMAFDEITEVVPWLEMAYDMGLDLDQDQQTHPRAFKSHLSWAEVPKGARYIVSVRDPKDALVSLYRFFEGWWFEPGSVSLKEIATAFYLNEENPSNYWHHLLSWWDHKDDSNVLILCFEDMKEKLPEMIALIAAFIGVELTDSLLATVSQKASFEYMQQHKSQFDDHLLRQARDPVVGLPPDGDSNKVRNGRVGDYLSELDQELSQRMDEYWSQSIESKLGFASYSDLRSALVY